MTNKEKELLLKDLCGRLPYGIKFPYHIDEDSNHRECDCVATMDTISEDTVEFTYDENGTIRDWSCSIKEVKPYLRPMSSMTEEEYEELWRICDFRVSSDDYDEFYRYGIQIIQEINNNKGNHQNREVDFSDYEDLIDWLNAHHFDYRDLIEKGLAIEAPKDMYKFD